MSFIVSEANNIKGGVMKKESILYGVIGLLAGLIIAGSTAGYSVNHNNSGMLRFMGVSGTHINSIDMPMGETLNDNSTSMTGTVNTLRGKTGDDFDKTFITDMISHHQSAIDMAKLAQQNAKHDEVKTLAGNIITAQTAEIAQMKEWQLQWGYIKSSSSSNGSTDMMH
jgi:hypothetical protein